MSRPKCQPGPIGLARTASFTRSAERDRAIRDWRRNNRTDDRLSGVRSQPLVRGKVQNLRGIDRRRATRARPGVNDTITHDWSRCRKKPTTEAVVSTHRSKMTCVNQIVGACSHSSEVTPRNGQHSAPSQSPPTPRVTARPAPATMKSQPSPAPESDRHCACPHCGSSFRLTAQLAGKQVRCLQCQTVFGLTAQ
jgi:predicted Zn finger-like uncharacterized protein